MPNNRSKNKLTRIVEDVFVFCRRKEYMTFNSSKKVVSTSIRGQKNYENIFNFIEAANNDGPCALNKATFSSEFATKLLKIYAFPEDECQRQTTVYDPFMGTGTTAVSAMRLNLKCYGSELSEQQCTYAINRLASETGRKGTEIVYSNYEEKQMTIMNYLKEEGHGVHV